MFLRCKNKMKLGDAWIPYARISTGNFPINLIENLLTMIAKREGAK